MSWTDERIDELRQLWENGLTASQIADKLGGGLSRNAVIGKAHRLGLKSRPSPVKIAEAAPAAPPAADAAPVVAASPAPEPVVRRPVPAPRPAPVGNGKTSLLELSDKVCKWPIGHPGEVDFHFCGKPSQASFPYCTEHCAIAYQAQMPRRDRPQRPMPPVPGMRPR